jgi:starvation-inducible DNA-binding protein
MERLNMPQSSVKEMPAKQDRESKSAPGPDTRINDRMYKNRIALTDDQKKKVVGILQERLAEALDMYSQAKFAHWNVKGVNFYQLHKVFDKVAKTIFPQIDAIAERLTQLGGVANGTVRQSASTSKIPEYNIALVAGMDHVNALADALGQYCKSLSQASGEAEDAGDDPTSDFFNQLIVDSEEQLYFLESHLEAGDVQ